MRNSIVALRAQLASFSLRLHLGTLVMSKLCVCVCARRARAREDDAADDDDDDDEENDDELDDGESCDADDDNVELKRRKCRRNDSSMRAALWLVLLFSPL